MRHEYIDALRKFEPIDAVVLEGAIAATPLKKEGQHIGTEFGLGAIVESKHLAVDVVATSADNLIKLGCLVPTAEKQNIPITFLATPFGRELIRACKE